MDVPNYKIPKRFTPMDSAAHLEMSVARNGLHSVVRRRADSASVEFEFHSRAQSNCLTERELLSQHPLLETMGFRGQVPGVFLYYPELKWIFWSDNVDDARNMLKEYIYSTRQRQCDSSEAS